VRATQGLCCRPRDPRLETGYPCGPALSAWPNAPAAHTVTQQVTGAELLPRPVPGPSRWLWLQARQQSGAKELQTKGFYLLMWFS